MPELLRIVLTAPALTRLEAEATRQKTTVDRLATALLEDIAVMYDPPPATRRSLSEVRAQRAAELAAVHTPSKIARHLGTATEAIRVILTKSDGNQ